MRADVDLLRAGVDFVRADVDFVRADVDFVRRAGLRLALAALDFEEPLLARDALLRLREDAAVFGRDDPLDFALVADPLDELLLLLLRVEADFLVAITDTSRISRTRLRRRTHFLAQ